MQILTQYYPSRFSMRIHTSLDDSSIFEAIEVLHSLERQPGALHSHLRVNPRLEDRQL